jgi:hypothetical protein
MKKTAVEWLRQELLKRDMDISIKDLFEQAKEMGKEQIIKAFTSAYLIGEDNITQEDARNEAEQYYNETYTHSINTVK